MPWLWIPKPIRSEKISMFCQQNRETLVNDERIRCAAMSNGVSGLRGNLASIGRLYGPPGTGTFRQIHAAIIGAPAFR
jgi:hypothetical protein